MAYPDILIEIKGSVPRSMRRGKYECVSTGSLTRISRCRPKEAQDGPRTDGWPGMRTGMQRKWELARLRAIKLHRGAPLCGIAIVTFGH